MCLLVFKLYFDNCILIIYVHVFKGETIIKKENPRVHYPVNVYQYYQWFLEIFIHKYVVEFSSLYYNVLINCCFRKIKRKICLMLGFSQIHSTEILSIYHVLDNVLLRLSQHKKSNADACPHGACMK